MKRIYLDNAATSFPKPKEVSKAMCNYIENIGSNVGRGGYESAYEASRTVYDTRELLCEMFNFDDTGNVIFTMNITDSLNMLIKGILKKGDHVITSSMEHNAVIRPLNSPMLEGVEVTKIECSIEGCLDPSQIEKNIKPNTKLIILTHASNVCGTIMPIFEVGLICKKYGIDFIVDTAQTAGIIGIDMKKNNISALAFTGHKGLMGPQGVGGFIVEKRLADKMTTIKEGGTGSFSEFETHPEIMPDKFESGTLNVPGIYGLNAAIKYINNVTVDQIRERESILSRKFLNNILNIDGVILYGMREIQNRTATFSINLKNMDNSEAGFILDREFKIMTRSGLHCAPLAHKTLGSFPMGSFRVSFGYFNTLEDVEAVSKAINSLTKR